MPQPPEFHAFTPEQMGWTLPPPAGGQPPRDRAIAAMQEILTKYASGLPEPFGAVARAKLNAALRDMPEVVATVLFDLMNDLGQRSGQIWPNATFEADGVAGVKRTDEHP